MSHLTDSPTHPRRRYSAVVLVEGNALSDVLAALDRVKRTLLESVRAFDMQGDGQIRDDGSDFGGFAILEAKDLGKGRTHAEFVRLRAASGPLWSAEMRRRIEERRRAAAEGSTR